jgi:2-polyprenyl-6-methoxyphenol hydroxylase-like FAD-dependent oxidoreductase
MYDNSRNELLRERGAVADGVVRRTLLPADLPDDLFAALRHEACLWDQPWRSSILDCVERRSIIGTPISEYVPERVVSGRLAMVGDAAHVLTPMTGNGFATSRDDAIALGRLLSGHADFEQALRIYEAERLPIVRSLVESGRQFSRTYGRIAHAGYPA